MNNPDEQNKDSKSKRPNFDAVVPPFSCYKAERARAYANAKRAGMKLAEFQRLRICFDPDEGESGEVPAAPAGPPKEIAEAVLKAASQVKYANNNLNQLLTLAHAERIPKPDHYVLRAENALDELQMAFASLMKMAGRYGSRN